MLLGGCGSRARPWGLPADRTPHVGGEFPLTNRHAFMYMYSALNTPQREGRRPVRAAHGDATTHHWRLGPRHMIPMRIIIDSLSPYLNIFLPPHRIRSTTSSHFLVILALSPYLIIFSARCRLYSLSTYLSVTSLSSHPLLFLCMTPNLPDLPCHLITLSPCKTICLSRCPLVSASPCLHISSTPYLISTSPYLRIPFLLFIAFRCEARESARPQSS